MSKASVIFPTSEFPNGKFDIKRLSNQVRGVYKSFETLVHADGVMIVTPNHILTQEEFDKLDTIISSHTGEPFDFLSKATSDQKRSKIQEILATARDRADLAPFVSVILQYLNFRNKELDGHIYYSATAELITLILADREAGEPYEALLNTEVTAPDAENPNGVKAYEFFIGKIQGLI